jgi:O-antigen/teichoic acid export membrane protein
MSDGPSSSDRAVQAGRGALFIGFAKVFFMVSGALQKLLLGRFVGPSVYGQFGVVNNAISIVNNTIVQGTIQSVSKFTAEDDSHIQPVKRAALVVQSFVGVILALVLVLGAPLIADGLNAPGYEPWLRMVAVIPLLYSFYCVFVGSASGQMKFRLQASFDVAFSTTKTFLLLGGALLLSRMGKSPVTGAFIGFIATAAIIMVVAAVKVGWPTGPQRFPASRLMAYMAGVMGYTLLINLALNADLLLLRSFAGNAVEQLRADALAGAYDAVRTLALLPYQALLVLTFVIFPLISRSTFVEDRAATRVYITQTLRYAILIGAAMAVVLSCRPGMALMLAYPRAGYAEGAGALPVLASGVLLLALLSVCGAIINASGRPRVMVMLMLVTVAVSVGTAYALVPRARPGAQMLLASATAATIGNALGLVLALVYLRRTFNAGPPLATVVRVLISGAVAAAAARVFPSGGFLMGVLTLAVVGAVFVAGLVILRELGAEDAAKLKKILRR